MPSSTLEKNNCSMAFAMPSLSSRVKEAVNAAKSRGYSIGDIARRCGISVQAVYQWDDPGKPLKEIKATSLMGLAELSGMNPWYINDGIGDKHLHRATNEAQKAALLLMQDMDIRDQHKMVRLGSTLTEPDNSTAEK